MNTSNKQQLMRWFGVGAIVVGVLILLLVSTVYQSTRQMMGLPPSPMMRVFTGDADLANSMPAGVPGMMARDSYGEETALYSKGMMPPTYPAPQPGGATPEDRARVGEKIIRNGSLTLRVDDAAKRLEELRRIVENAKGFVANANITDNANVKTAYVTVRVPNEKFDEVRTAAKALATTVFVETENADDVTAQFVDLQARLTAAKAEEQSYLEILKRSGTIEDTLAVTQQLSRVRSTIEQLQGQMRYMNDQTSYATLTITLTEETKVEAPTRTWKPLETFRIAMRGLVESLQDVADAAITAGVFLIGLLLPTVLLVWLIVWVIMKIVRRVSKK